MFTNLFGSRGDKSSDGARETVQDQPAETSVEESAPVEGEINEPSQEADAGKAPTEEAEAEQAEEEGSILNTALGIGTSVGRTAYSIGETTYSVVGTTFDVGGKIVGGIVDTSIYLTNTAYGAALATIDIGSKPFLLAFSHLSSSVTALAQLANAGASATVEGVGQTFEAVFDAVIETTSLAGKTVDLTLVSLSGEANEETTFSTQGMRLGVGLLPVVGEVQTYGEARKLYREADQIEDEAEREEMKQEARRKCLVACTLIGVQAAALPLTGAAQIGMNAASTVIGAADTAKTVQRETKERWYLPTIGVDLLTPHADTALQYEPIHDAMEWLLLVEYDPDKYLKDVDDDTDSEQA